MAQGVDERTGSGLLTGLAAALDALWDDRIGLLSGPEQLGLLKDSLRLGGRFQAWQAQLAARIDAAEVAWQEHGTSTATWLADAVNLTRREAGRLIAAGHGLRTISAGRRRRSDRRGVAYPGGGDHRRAG